MARLMLIMVVLPLLVGAMGISADRQSHFSDRLRGVEHVDNKNVSTFGLPQLKAKTSSSFRSVRSPRVEQPKLSISERFDLFLSRVDQVLYGR